MKKNKKHFSIFELKKLWYHIQNRRRTQLFLLIFLMLFVSLTEIISISAVLPFLAALTNPEMLYDIAFIQPILLKMGFTNSDQLPLPMTIVFIIAVVFAGLMRIVLLWTQTHFAYAIGADISIRVYRSALYSPYIEQVSTNSSEFISGISHKTHLVVTQVIMPSLLIISSTMILLAIFMTVIFIQPHAALTILFSIGCIYGFVSFLSKKKLLEHSEKINHKSNLLIKALQEGFGGIRDVLIDGTQEVFCKIFRDSDLPLRKAQAEISIVGQSPRFIVEALGVTILAIFAFYLSVRDGGIEKVIPILGVFVLAAQRLLPIFHQIYQSWTSIIGCSALLKEILFYLDKGLPKYLSQPLSGEIEFKNHIELRNVNFYYDANRESILEDFSCKIKKGERVGLIGATGSGKSTLVDIILGLLAPRAGGMYVDNKIILERNYRSWQKHISHVPQNIFLADTTISENIAFGVPTTDIDYKLVHECARKAQIAETIDSWPFKYNTIVGERGIRLSGGQKQRIGIARALYKKTDIIIFDEATSALDDKTELKVINSIFNLDENITILIIAHRLSTLKKCTQVIELVGGRVLQSGTYKEIVGKT